MESKNRVAKYNKFDVVYADFGCNPNGVQSGIRPAVIVSADAGNRGRAPQISVVPLSSKLKEIPVHVKIEPADVRGYGLKCTSDFMPEDVQTLSKGSIRGKSGYIPSDSMIREEIDRAMIMQFNLLPVARKMILEEMQNGQ
jgi:mRNA interferase MazF